mmetsp:Transcript_125317/g.390144  ORF Transcript_125317/g.390144 Transcript_125317/m.390144 type:complete len:204 (-) Transcript_125317:68-679(-)
MAYDSSPCRRRRWLLRAVSTLAVLLVCSEVDWQRWHPQGGTSPPESCRRLVNADSRGDCHYRLLVSVERGEAALGGYREKPGSLAGRAQSYEQQPRGLHKQSRRCYHWWTRGHHCIYGARPNYAGSGLVGACRSFSRDFVWHILGHLDTADLRHACCKDSLHAAGTPAGGGCWFAFVYFPFQAETCTKLESQQLFGCIRHRSP